MLLFVGLTGEMGDLWGDIHAYMYIFLERAVARGVENRGGDRCHMELLSGRLLGLSWLQIHVYI